jgi:multidrug efflux pump subunit AcrA (membrane-fusion protein)
VTRAGTVEELDVVPGIGAADSVEVRGPLSPGDRLVVRGAERLADGQAVKVINAPARGPNPG